MADDIQLTPEEPAPEDRPPTKAEEETGEIEVEEKEEDTSVRGEVVDAFEAVMPWMTSLLLHLGIVVLTLFVVWGVVPALAEDDKPIIPIARLSENPGGGSLTATSSSLEVGLKASQNTRNVATEAITTGGESLDASSTALGEGEALELIGVSGGGGGEAGLAPFGATVSDGPQEFMGIGIGDGDGGGNARKLIYLVDASGSLIDTLPFVVKELKNSISSLTDQQSYTVIFFQDGEPLEVEPKGWKPATAENKRKTFDYINLDNGNIVPRGKTDPIKALRLAMRYKPELLFILSDNITGRGEYEVDREDLLKELNTLNKDRKSAINTIQFLYPDPLNTLSDIAKEHGGISKFITETDLGLR